MPGMAHFVRLTASLSLQTRHILILVYDKCTRNDDDDVENDS